MEYIIKEATFIQSSPSLQACAKSDEPEFAFIGRSNVGKSSLINMIANKKGLAKTSSTPGKTKLINFFHINNTWRLVDLPGYGYAKVPKGQRTEFRQLILDYLAKRDNLYCVFVLIDCRIAPQDIDIRFINWLGQTGVPLILVGTKSEKVTQADIQNFEKEYKKLLIGSWDEMPQWIFTSAIKKTGRNEILSIIESSLNREIK
jgi:GTP-binding protein